VAVLRRIAALHLVALLLAALTAAGAALPTMSRLVAGDPDHACHCASSGGHSHCACPKCFPELKDDGLVDGPFASSRCGDDDAGWQTRASLAVPLAAFVLEAPSRAIAPAPTPARRQSRERAGPEPPPPKTVRS
jgi:hypothetical protein